MQSYLSNEGGGWYYDKFYLDTFEQVCRIDVPTITGANPIWGSTAYEHYNYINSITNGSGERFYLDSPNRGHSECLHYKLFNI